MVDNLSENKYRVKFLPDNLEVFVDPGTNLLTAAIAAGAHLNASCGGQGTCGTCKVKLESGSVECHRTRALSDEECTQGIRQACQSTINSDLVVTILDKSRLDKAVQTREQKSYAGISPSGWRFNPSVNKYYLELPPPTLKDNVDDLSRVLRGLAREYNLHELRIEPELLVSLSEIIRKDNWKITVTTLLDVAQPASALPPLVKIINLEPGDTMDNLYSLAIDVGTTTVCGQLLDLKKGKIVADSIVFNKQIPFGADVIARIAFTQKPGINGLKKLQEMVVESINEVIDNLLSQSKLKRSSVIYVAVAGNTTMTQLLHGLDPKYIRLSPYVPVAKFIPPVKAESLGIKVDCRVYIYTFPCISSYVGGDIVSGIIASGVHQRNKLTFFMDIGTNGEIVIGNADWMVTASCSAGPAFEGGGIRFGMVAMKGAIQDISINASTLEPTIQTIYDAKPKGICGSGLINTIAGLLEVGAIGQNGKFNNGVSSSRIRKGTDGYEYVLTWAEETQIGKDIVITEADIDNLIRSKAAMYAGCHTLSRSVDINCCDFEQVILAGNFGSSLNVEKAITIGLLPDLPRERFTFIGNSSLSGARLVSFSTDLLNDSTRVAQMMTNIELSENNDFNQNYIAALFLPHTDERSFPSINGKLKTNTKI